MSRAILQAASCDVVVPQGAKASAAMYWRLQMIEQSVPGLVFFRGGHGVYGCTAHHVTQISARMHADDLGLLPTDSYVTFDNRAEDVGSLGDIKPISRSPSQIGSRLERMTSAKAAGLRMTWSRVRANRAQKI